MAANSRRSNNGHILRSLSPPGRSYSSKYQSSSSLLPRSTSHCSTSRASMSVYKYAASTPSARPVSVSENRKLAGPSQTKRTCLCSPTNHPGSFRCSLHKNTGKTTTSFVSNKLERSAMANSLVRHGAVEGDLVKRALAALIRPSSHQLRRRDNFQKRPSRLSVMSQVKDCPVLSFEF